MSKETIKLALWHHAMAKEPNRNQAKREKHEATAKFIEEALAQPSVEQKPVVFYRCNGCEHEYQQMHPTSCDCMKGSSFEQVNYYTTPPQRTWVGLTEIQQVTLVYRFRNDPVKLAMEIERELKENNNG